MVPPEQILIVDGLMPAVGVALTITLPVISVEVQPLAFFTVKVNGMDIPEAAALKLTGIEALGKVAFVTAVMPVPEIE